MDELTISPKEITRNIYILSKPEAFNVGEKIESSSY